MKIALSRIHFPVTTLGPGKRIGVWFQGCSIRCEGCISMDTWQQDINEVALTELMAVIERWLPQSDGITVSGGEPFDQPEALKLFLQEVKSRGLPVWLYSGYEYGSLKKRLTTMEGLIDVLIAGPFKAHLQNNTSALAGSTNQQIYCLSESGLQQYKQAAGSLGNNKLDVMFDGQSLWMAGVPGKNFFRDFRQALQATGHHIKHTQHGDLQ